MSFQQEENELIHKQKEEMKMFDDNICHMSQILTGMQLPLDLLGNQFYIVNCEDCWVYGIFGNEVYLFNQQDLNNLIANCRSSQLERELNGVMIFDDIPAKQDTLDFEDLVEAVELNSFDFNKYINGIPGLPLCFKYMVMEKGTRKM